MSPFPLEVLPPLPLLVRLLPLRRRRRRRRKRKRRRKMWT